MEKKKGKWLSGDKIQDDSSIPYRSYRHYCSECKEVAISQEGTYGYEGNEWLFNFCPHCGADMR